MSSLDVGLSRIQFTPDLLPSDRTGTKIYQNIPVRLMEIRPNRSRDRISSIAEKLDRHQLPAILIPSLSS